MGIITTSLVVEFDSKDGEGILNLEVDDRIDGLNKGVTDFAPGDEVGLLLYKTSNVVIDQIIVSSGNIQQAGQGSRPIEEFVTFANENTASPRYPIMSGFSFTWAGNSLGGLTVVSENTVRAGSVGVAAAQIKYTTTFQQLKLINVPLSLNGLTSFPIVVFVSGHT